MKHKPKHLLFKKMLHRLNHEPQASSEEIVTAQIRTAVVKSLYRAERYLTGEPLHDGKGRELKDEDVRKEHFESAMALIDTLGDKLAGGLAAITYRKPDAQGIKQVYHMSVDGVVFDEEEMHLALLGPSVETEESSRRFSLRGLGEFFDIEIT